MSERELPANLEAEEGVLGSLLIDPETIVHVVDILTPLDFYRNAHQLIYAAILTLHNRQEPADYITICDVLEQDGKLAIVGGPGAINLLINAVPTGGNVEYYARIVAKCALRRKLCSVAGQIAQLAYHEEDQLLEQAEQLLFALRKNTEQAQFVDMPELMRDYMDELEFLHEHRGQFLGVPTGYHDLDVPLAGLQKSDLILLGGRPSMGKTALALCIAMNAAARQKRVAVFSLEMGRKLLARRLMSMQTKIDAQRLRGGWVEDDEWERVIAGISNLSSLPISINDTAGNPISSMRSQLRRYVQRKGGVDLVVVDYIGLIEPDVDASKRDNQVQIISAISRGLKTLAREFDVPVLALCQLSRQVESRQNKRPQLSDLRDSGSLEQDADVVMFVYRDDYYNKSVEGYQPTNIAEVIIEKHRNGPTGNISLYWQPEQTAFYPLEYGIGGING